jgi:hypothetical protein
MSYLNSSNHPIAIVIDRLDLIVNISCRGGKDNDFIENCKRLHKILERLKILADKGIHIICCLCLETNIANMSKYHLKLYDILYLYFTIYAIEKKEQMLAINKLLFIKGFDQRMSLQNEGIDDENKNLNNIVKLINNTE